MGGARRVRYRHLKRTVTAVLAAVAFVLLFGLLLRVFLEAEPTRRMAKQWLEEVAADRGVELEIGELHWGAMPPGLRLGRVNLRAAGVSAEVDGLQIDLGKIWLTERTVELDTVAARGVRLSLDGLPQPTDTGGGQLRIQVRHLELSDVEFEGVDLPGGLALDLKGVRAGWTREDEEARGYVEIAAANLQIGKMAPIDAALRARFTLADDGFELSNYRLDSKGFALQGRGRVAAGGARFEIGGPLDVGWLDGFLRTRGLLAGTAEVSVVLDTTAEALLEAEVRAPHLEAAGFPLDDVVGRLALVGRSLRGTLTRATFHGGTLAGEYDLREFGGTFPHSVRLRGTGISLEGFLDNLRVESAGLAATVELNANGAWNGRAFGAGRGHASVQFHGAAPGLPIEGSLLVGLTGEGFLRFDAEELAIGSSRARWQGALTLGTWEPAWAIDARPAVLEEIGPLVNAWVGSTMLPDELAGTGHLQVNLSGPFSDLVVHARVDAQPLILAPMQLDRLVAEFTIAGSELRLSSGRFQLADGFGEIEGGLAWGEAVGDDQLDLKIRGRRIPLSAIATWVGLEEWVDAGLLSFAGDLEGPIGLPRGKWNIDLEDLMLAGLELGTASSSIGLADGRFSCSDLRCNRGLEADLWWNVGGAEIGGSLWWPQMPLTALDENISRLAGELADVRLDFSFPLDQKPTAELVADSQSGHFEMRAGPDGVQVEAKIEGVADAHAALEREADGMLRGDGALVLLSAGGLLEKFAPEAGVPLTGTGSAVFTIEWGDEALPRLTGLVDALDLELQNEPVQLIEPARFLLSEDGFEVPGLQLRAREDELFVRWNIGSDGSFRGNLSGTMDTLLLRFMLPDWEPAGRATGIVEFLGTTDDPLFEGIAEIEKGSFRLPGTRTILSQVNGTVLLSSGDVLLEGMDFRFMGGRGQAGGRIRESDENIVLSLAGTASGIRFEVLPDLDARLSGTWRLNGPVDDLNLSGDLVVDRMNLTTKDHLATILLSWIGSTGQSTAEGGLSLNLHVDAEETIDLRSPFVRLKGSAGLEVTGTSNRPGLVGQVEVLEGGEATLLGNRYEIERGSLNFSNPEAIDPFIDLQASTWVQDYQVTVQLAGTLDRFVSTAVSTPPLSLPDIYSLLGVGYRGSSLGSSAMGLGLASSILSSELTSVLTRRGDLVLPVDQVRVDPFELFTANPTARLSVIKQLTPSWTVILQTTLSSEREQIVVSRWYLAPGLFIEAAQHEDRSLSFDLKMRRPY